jgi:hypothetical protein
MKRRRFLRWLAALLLLGVALAAAALFSPVVRVTDIAVSGAVSVPEQLIGAQVELGFEASWLGRLLGVRSQILFDAVAVRESLMREYPQFAQATVAKVWPHGVTVSVTERALAGAWCRRLSGEGDSCRYWDRTGARWGSAVPSVGPLLLLVMDERTGDELEPAFLEGVLAAVDGTAHAGLAVRRVVLPDAEPGGVRLDLSAGYELRMDALGDVEEQLSTLKVFLGEKAKDPAFHPQYLDLRTAGRVYFR